MAKRRSKARALQPAVMKLHYALETPEGANSSSTHYLSITRDISRLNRRFYRQGLNVAIANVRVTTLPAAAGVQGSQCYVNSIPHTWPVANGWVKAFHAWKNQQDDAIDEMGGESGVARFRDFKIAMEDGMTVGNTASPVNLGPGRVIGAFPPGLKFSNDLAASEEWLASQIVIPNDGAPGNTVEYGLHMVGPSTASSKGIITGYEFSRSFPQSPDPITPAMETSWLNKLHNVGDNSDEIVVNATDRNDELPYQQEDYPGSTSNFVQLETQGYNLNQSTVGVNTFNTGPFTAPCGLIRIDINDVISSVSSGAGAFTIVTVDLVPGNHRGYLCESMEEF